MEKLANRTYKVVFPEEIAGRLKLSHIRNVAGDTLKIRYLCTIGEDYDYNGISEYVSGGRGDETYAPVFDWYVFHSAIVENWEGDLTADDAVAEAVGSHVPTNATFRTSDTLGAHPEEQHARRRPFGLPPP